MQDPWRRADPMYKPEKEPYNPNNDLLGMDGKPMKIPRQPGEKGTTTFRPIQLEDMIPASVKQDFFCDK